jgi:HlyD family secretion protein
MIKNPVWAPGSLHLPVPGFLLLSLSLSCAAAAPERDELQGVVELHERALAFELPGRVARLLVQRGQRVEAGALLAVLDDGLERPARDARAADVAQVEAQLALLEAGARREDLRALRAQVEGAQAAEAQATQTAKRLRELRAAGTATPQQLDDAESLVARATAERKAASERLASLESGARREDVRAVRARLDSARAALALSESRLQRYQLIAPIAGHVLDTHVEPGEVLGAGAPVVTLGETQRPYVDLFVPEAGVNGLRPGTKATVRIDAEPGRVFDGEVEDVGRRTEFTPRYLFSPKERPNLVVRVRVALRDPEERLRAGVPALAKLDRSAVPSAPGPATAAPGAEVRGIKSQPTNGGSGR